MNKFKKCLVEDSGNKVIRDPLNKFRRTGNAADEDRSGRPATPETV